MKRAGLLICILTVLSLSITGCWSRRELDTLAIAVGLGIDKSGDTYKVTVQVVEPSEIAGKSSGNLSPVTYYQATGGTILEALRKMTTVSPRKIYVAHLRILILGEALAREGIKECLEFFSRETEIRNDFFIIVAKEAAAEDTLRVLTNLERVPSVRLFSSLETSEKQWAPTTIVKLDRLIADLTSPEEEAVLTGIRIIGDVTTGENVKNVQIIKSPAELKYSGLAVFKEDKLIGWLNNEEGKAYNYIDNHVSSTAGRSACPDGGQLGLKVIRSRSKVKGSVHNGKPHVDIEVHTVANISEVHCALDLTKSESITKVEQLAAKRTKDLLEETITRVQHDYKVDIFGFGGAIHRSSPKEWKTLKDNWNDNFQKLTVNVKVFFDIKHTGKVSDSYLQKME